MIIHIYIVYKQVIGLTAFILKRSLWDESLINL